MFEFDRVCDIWKSFWQALEEEILALGSRVEVLERLSKKDLRPAIRELAKAAIGQAPTRVVESQAPVVFDVQKAQAIWKSGVLWENPELPYCTFIFRNEQNQTRLHVGINHSDRKLQVEVNLTTLDCPDLGQGQDKPHQHLMSLCLRQGVVGEVKYHEENRYYVEFVLKPVPGMRHRHFCIYDGGKVHFSDW